MEVATSSARNSVEHGSETTEPQQDSSPNLPEPSPKKCLTLLSDALKKDGVDSVDVATSSARNSVEYGFETAEPQQDSSPNLPPKKCLTFNCLEWIPWKWPLRPQGALWSTVPKQQNPSRIQAQTCQNHPPKNCLTLLSDALKKDDATAWSGLRGIGHLVRKELCGAWLRNSKTPAGFKPKPARTIPKSA